MTTVVNAACCRMVAEESPFQLLALPDPCLLAVLQCCASDLRSLFSAARAHPRLHQAAVLALSSITVDRVRQQQVDGLLQYLTMYGQHLNNVTVASDVVHLVTLRQLPPNLQPNSLDLTNFQLQLQPGGGAEGLVRPGLPLKRLRLFFNTLLDGAEGLAAALSAQPGLQHIAMNGAH